jgi:DNA-directed RNA polymerase specialized sigma24 family protein
MTSSVDRLQIKPRTEEDRPSAYLVRPAPFSSRSTDHAHAGAARAVLQARTNELTHDALPRSTTYGGTESRWNLTEGTLQRLLVSLDPDPERAGELYEGLRRRLDSLFRFWGADSGWELADRTLDRVAAKLEEGAVVPSGALPGYVRGVARLLFYEAARERKRELRTASSAPQREPFDAETERALGCLDDCLETLHPNDRRLILDYYGNHGARTIEVRKNLAAGLGVSPTALRIRAHRLRQRLEECLAAAMNWTRRSGEATKCSVRIHS